MNIAVLVGIQWGREAERKHMQGLYNHTTLHSFKHRIFKSPLRRKQKKEKENSYPNLNHIWRVQLEARLIHGLCGFYQLSQIKSRGLPKRACHTLQQTNTWASSEGTITKSLNGLAVKELLNSKKNLNFLTIAAFTEVSPITSKEIHQRSTKKRLWLEALQAWSL